MQKLSSAANVRPSRIPSSWQSQFSDLRDYAGVAWYWRTITLPPPAADQVALLQFGAVDYAAEVYVNGQKAGAHEGGYLPFEIDVTSLLHVGDNQVAVRVADPGRQTARRGRRHQLCGNPPRQAKLVRSNQRTLAKRGNRLPPARSAGGRPYLRKARRFVHDHRTHHRGKSIRAR